MVSVAAFELIDDDAFSHHLHTNDIGIDDLPASTFSQIFANSAEMPSHDAGRRCSLVLSEARDAPSKLNTLKSHHSFVIRKDKATFFSGTQSQSFSLKAKCREVEMQRSRSRRHSIAAGATTDLPTPQAAIDFYCSRSSSGASQFSVASFAGGEYSTMMSEWVDSCLGEVEDRLMVLSGSDFKSIALRRYAAADDRPAALDLDAPAATRPETEESTDGDVDASSVVANAQGPAVSSPAAAPHGADGCADGRRDGTPLGLDLTAPAHNDVLEQLSRGANRPDTATPLSARSRKLARRRSAFDGRPWPTFSGGEEGLAAARARLRELTFNALDLSHDDLSVLAAEIFYQMDLDTSLRISRESVQNFIQSVRARMLDNHYHNWTHVVDVTQTVYSLALQSGVLQGLSPKQRLVLYLAALCHDLEHPGVTAGYLLKSKSTLAARYKADLGLLEKHHSIRAFQLLACHDINLLGSLSNMEKLEVTSLVRDVIMATDMRQHAEYAAAVAAAADGGQGEGGDGAAAGEGGGAAPDALFSMQLLLKCADISNVLKPFSVAREWAIRVTDEFFAQGDLERDGGLEVTPMCDRAAQSRVGLQRGFIDHVAGPFHRGVARLLPRLQPLLEQMEENRRRWDEVTDEELLAGRRGGA